MSNKQKTGLAEYLFYALVGLAIAFSGCRHLTVAPKPTEARRVAMGSTNLADADIIDCDGRGCLVRQAWVDAYFALETKFKENITADKLIKGEGEFYRIPYQVNDHDADMRRRAKIADVGP